MQAHRLPVLVVAVLDMCCASGQPRLRERRWPVLVGVARFEAGRVAAGTSTS
jgi:hypothetical protein